MNDFGFTRFFSELATWVFDTTSVTILAGLIVFLLTLWILPMTKWGRTNPVAKCVGLSVLAHVLLLCYAYGTSLITEIPIHHPPKPVPIRIVYAESEPAAEQPDDHSESAPKRPFWRQVGETSLHPTMTSSQSSPRKQTARETNTKERDQFVPSPEKLTSSQQPAMQSLPDARSSAQSATPKKSMVSSEVLAKNFRQNSKSTLEPKSGTRGMSRVSGASYFDSKKWQDTSKFSSDHWLKEQVASPNLQKLEKTQRQASDLIANPKSFEKIEDGSKSSWDIAQRNANGLANQLSQSVTGQVRQQGSEFGKSSIVGDTNSSAESPVTEKSRPSVYRRIVDGRLVPKRYHKRFQKDPRQLREAGATPETEKAVRKALAYLARTQKVDGSFDPRLTEGGKEKNVYGHNRKGAGAQADTGITGLALLAWMANGNTHLEGPYKANVRKGLNYLIKRQQNNGSLAGSAQFFAQMYCHSMALLAISEAYCLTGDPELAAPLKKAVDFSQRSQNRVSGGWRYRPGEQGDMSQFGWQVMALVSARLAGTSVDNRTEALMRVFLAQHTTGRNKGLHFYRVGESPSSTMTAEGLFCRFLLRENVPAQAIVEACDRIVERGTDGRLNNLPSSSGNNLYFWYYGTLALHQAAKEPAVKNNAKVQQAWKKWNQTLQVKLTGTQELGGKMDGSWDSDKFLWGCYGGRVYTTSMAVLSLQIYYRYDLDRPQPRPAVAGRVTDQNR